MEGKIKSYLHSSLVEYNFSNIILVVITSAMLEVKIFLKNTLKKI
jgi:hypothetical protein